MRNQIGLSKIIQERIKDSQENFNSRKTELEKYINNLEILLEKDSKYLQELIKIIQIKFSQQTNKEINFTEIVRLLSEAGIKQINQIDKKDC